MTLDIKVNGKYTALYNRVSTEKQAEHGTSLDNQEDMCFKKAHELGVEDSKIKVYRDAASGSDIDRPMMNELREDVRNGLIDKIIIVHPDRLSRDMVDRLIVCSEFEKYGVDLIFIDTEYKNTPEGQLFFNMQSSIAQYELSLIKKRTKRGSIKSSKDGKIMGLKVAPYGYDYVKGKGTFEINKEESQYVKRIFQWYVYDNLTMREIGDKLCALGAKPKLNKTLEWSHSSIQRILKNETYIGKFYYNRRKTTKIKGEKSKNGKPKKGYEYRDKDEWIEITVPVIIDHATFALAEEQRYKNTKHSGNIKHEYLLRQKLRCSHCGNKYSSYTSSSYSKQKDENGKPKNKYSRKAYRCTGTTNRKSGENVEKCKAKIIGADYLEEYIWNELIMNIINNTDSILEQVKNQYEKPNQEVEETYNLLKLKLNKLEEEKKRTVQLFKKGYIEEEEMDKDIIQINNNIKDLKMEMSKYEKQISNIGKNELNVKILKEKIEKIKEKLENEDKILFNEKRQIIDYLIDEIIVKWENNTMRVTCIGMIGDLMANDPLREDDSVVDTTSRCSVHEQRVFNLLYEVLFSISKSKRKNELGVIESSFNIV